MTCDLKLTGGRVIDGTGAAGRRADVALRGDAIAEIGDLAALQAAEVIDCTGRVVAPGIIDIHSHSDWLVPDPRCGSLVEPFVRQGMTTLVAGNCGFSPAPLSERNAGAARESSRLVVDDVLEPRWSTMDEFLSRLEAGGVPLNLAQLVGHGTVRAAVMGPLDPAAPSEDQRAAKAGGARLQLSHLIFVGRKTWPTSERAIAAIECEREGGLDVAFDAFPYTAGNTTASALFPPEMLPHLESILQSAEAMEGVKALGRRVFEQIGFFLEDIQILKANATAFDEFNGLFVGEAARRAGMDVWEFYARLVVESRRNARVLNHTYSGQDGDEEALCRVLAHPLCTIETDTFLSQDGHQNPAAYGTFPRVLHTYVREGLFPLEEAVRKMTGAAAERLGWRDRGFVRTGCAADLVVFDPEELRDTATFAEPARFPTGIEHVFINGAHVLADGRYDSDARAGRVLRS